MGRVNVSVLYFGQARDAAGGRTEESFSLADPAFLKDVISEAHKRHGRLAKIMEMLQFAVNEELVDTDAKLNDGDEVAFLPPVVGG